MRQTAQGFGGSSPWLAGLRSRRSSHGTWLQFHPCKATGHCGFLMPQGRNDGYHLIISWLLCAPAVIEIKKMLLWFVMSLIVKKE